MNSVASQASSTRPPTGIVVLSGLFEPPACCLDCQLYVNCLPIPWTLDSLRSIVSKVIAAERAAIRWSEREHLEEPAELRRPRKTKVGIKAWVCFGDACKAISDALLNPAFYKMQRFPRKRWQRAIDATDHLLNDVPSIAEYLWTQESDDHDDSMLAFERLLLNQLESADYGN